MVTASLAANSHDPGLQRKGQCFPVTSSRPAPAVTSQTKPRTLTRRPDQLRHPPQQERLPRRNGNIITQGDLKPRSARKLSIAAQGNQVLPEVLREVPWDGKEEVKSAPTRRPVSSKLQEGRCIAPPRAGLMGSSARWGFHGLRTGQSDRNRPGLPRPPDPSPGRYPARRWRPLGVEQVTSRNLDVSGQKERT